MCGGKDPAYCSSFFYGLNHDPRRGRAFVALALGAGIVLAVLAYVRARIRGGQRSPVADSPAASSNADTFGGRSSPAVALPTCQRAASFAVSKVTHRAGIPGRGKFASIVFVPGPRCPNSLVTMHLESGFRNRLYMSAPRHDPCEATIE